MTSLVKRAIHLGISPFRACLAKSLFTRFFPGVNDEDIFWLLVHLAEQAGNGHIRTDIGRIAEESPRREFDTDLPERLQQRCKTLVESALEKGLIGRLETENARADSLPIPRPPLVLTSDGSYLYFLRRRREEDNFLSMLGERTKPASRITDEQKTDPAATLLSLITSGEKFLLLAGGPGTGKTTTIAHLLERLGPSFRVLLTAPTGRAASRMAENIPGHSGRTLHALLGIAPGHRRKHNQRNPLEADMVVVDEASMVDLPLMNALLQGISPETVLLLVGDPDQLPSVEAGALLGDLLTGANEAANTHKVGPLSNSVVQLTKVYRSNTAVLEAAAAVREGDIKRLLVAADGDSVRIAPLEQTDRMAAILADKYSRYTGSLDAFISLTPLRRGPWGVPSMNEKISRLMGGTTSPFAGMPIVVTQNDASRNLWNGDRALLHTVDKNLRAFFYKSDAKRNLPLAVLPGWEPAWIQTIHRSQGSEFDAIAVILPEGAGRLLSREILYTALTRAKHTVDIYADEGTLAAALQHGILRHSRIRCWARGESESPA